MATEQLLDVPRPLGGLCVLLANEDKQSLGELKERIEDLGHEVLARAVHPREVGAALAEDEPDIALVEVRDDPDHALELMRECIAKGDCPVVLVLDEADEEFVSRAARIGVFATVRPTDDQALRDAIEVAVRRHEEMAELGKRVEKLDRALERRAVIERAKGILMERHKVGEAEAFELLRGHSRSNNRRVSDVAASVVEGHALLPGPD